MPSKADDKTRENAELETVDLPGVEIMAAGGPIHGKGSPPEGDHYSVDDLKAIAKANQALAEEITPPNKLGHSKEQKVLTKSGLWYADDGDKPASGWWTNFRVEGDRLLADAKDVPKKLAALFKKGAFRKRSVELSSRTSQKKDGKKFDSVVTAVAWLGAKSPAVYGLADPKSLDEVAAMYEDQAVDVDDLVTVECSAAEDDPLKLVEYAEGDVVWDPATGYGALRDKVNSALNPNGMDTNPRYWVRDTTATQALVTEGYGDDVTAWVVPFSIDSEGDLHVAPQNEWTMAKQEWVESSQQFAERQREENSRRADTRTTVAEIKLTEENVKALAEHLGVEDAESLDESKLLEAAEARKTELEEAKAAAEAAPAADDKTFSIDGEELTAETLRQLKSNADDGKRAMEELRTSKRDALIGNAMNKGKITPAQEDTWKKAFDENEELATSLIADLPVNETLVRTYGSDGDGLNLNGEQSEEKTLAEREAIAKQYGLELDEVPA